MSRPQSDRPTGVTGLTVLPDAHRENELAHRVNDQTTRYCCGCDCRRQPVTEHAGNNIGCPVRPWKRDPDFRVCPRPKGQHDKASGHQDLSESDPATPRLI